MGIRTAPLQERARTWGPTRAYPWRVAVCCVLCNQTPGSRAAPVAREVFRRWPSPGALAAADGRELRELVRPLGLQGRADTLRRLSAAWPPERVEDLPGLGPYAADAHAIFVDGRRDLAPDDHVLAAWLAQINHNRKGTHVSTTADKSAAEKPLTLTELLTGAGLPGVGQAIVAKALDESEITPEARAASASDEQRRRCAQALEGVKAGLRGKALALWIITGKDSREQIATARAKRTTQERTERSAKRSAAAKASGRRPPARASKYPPEITEAVRLAIAARGTRNGAPGCKQHILVRGALTDPADAKAILRDAGVKSEANLRAIAGGSAPKDDLKALRPLAEKIDDRFCKGRNLASILVAAIEQAKS